MKQFLRILFAMIWIPLVLLVLLFATVPLTVKNGIFTPWPHVNTEFAADFSSQKFELVRVGMPKQEVEQLLGKPLFYLPNAPCDEHMARYSRKNNILFNLLSWQGYEIFYGPDCKVIQKRSSWWDESTS